jgi:hypothetical protein
VKSKVLGILLAAGLLLATACLALAQGAPATGTDSTKVAPDSTAVTPAAAPAAAAPAATAPAAAAPTTPPPAPAPTAPPAKTTSSGPSRIYYGGTATFSIGSTSSIGIFPMIGYKLTPKISGGVEFGYEHVSYGNDQSTDNYGGSVFGRLRVGRNLYGHVEYQSMNYEIYDSYNSSSREWVPALFLGAGYVRPLAARSSFYAEVLFDMLQDENSPYGDWEPIVRVGVAVGF